jgi:hypothetical protein
VRALTDFALPYDPLVSYFLHREAARLYERIPDADPEAQFRHLRYSIYFGPPADLSVGNVVAALQLLSETPELIADPVERWDEMNSLLEVLKQRSSLRLRLDGSASAFELVDAERSIRAAEQAVETMDQLRAEAGFPADEWNARKTILTRMLIRPMWKYHSQQAARLAKLQAQQRAITAETADSLRTQ